jgi:hypothetical protein
VVALAGGLVVRVDADQLPVDTVGDPIQFVGVLGHPLCECRVVVFADPDRDGVAHSSSGDPVNSSKLARMGAMVAMSRREQAPG